MRVLQVLHNYPPEFRGGVEQHVESTHGGLTACGIESAVFCGSEARGPVPALHAETWNGVKVWRFSRGPGLSDPVDPFSAEVPAAFEHVLDTFRPDVVHVHHWWNLTDDLVRRAVRRRIPTVVTFHDFFSTCPLFFRLPDNQSPCDLIPSSEHCGPCLEHRMPHPRPVLDTAIQRRVSGFQEECRAAQVRLAPSEAHRRALESYLGEEVKVLPLGTDAPLTAPRRARLGGPVRILHFGNLCRLKGSDFLVTAVRAADPSGKALSLRLLGRQVESDLDLGDCAGEGPFDDLRLADFLSEGDLAVFPSLARETYGRCVDEALRAGLPVWVSDRGALGERIGTRGRILPAGDLDAWTGAFSELAQRPETLDGLYGGVMGDVLGSDEHAQRLAAVYRQCRDQELPSVDVEGPLYGRMAAWQGWVAAWLTGPTPSEAPMNSIHVTPAVAVDPDPRLVSVIVRTKDRPAMLAEALESVAQQTWPHLEVVVCNDGGADVRHVVDGFRERLSLRLLQPNPGVGRCAAGNLAMAWARGQWIAWLDDDDLYLPEHLETLVTAAMAQGRKVAYSDSYRVFVTRDEKGRWVERDRDQPFPSLEFDRLRLTGGMVFHLVSVIHHRECVEKLGGMDPTLLVLEDWDLFYRFAQSYDFLHVPSVTALFRIRDDGTNAVTALHRDFVNTRSALLARYAHVAIPALVEAVLEGRHHIASLLHRMNTQDTQAPPQETR